LSTNQTAVAFAIRGRAMRIPPLNTTSPFGETGAAYRDRPFS
jgi:hypothetical protein